VTEASHEAAQLVIDTYGEPQEVTASTLSMIAVIAGSGGGRVRSSVALA
jgi:hypothetical protein